MEPLLPTLTFEELRQAKKNASKSLESLGIQLSSSTIGNLVANTFGYQDWNTASATAKHTPHDHREEKPSDSSQSAMRTYEESAVLEIANDCAKSIRLSHFNELRAVLENTRIIDMILSKAVIITYNRKGRDARMHDLTAFLKEISIPPSISPVMGEIIYLLEATHSNTVINYYGALDSFVSANKQRCQMFMSQLVYQ